MAKRRRSSRSYFPVTVDIPTLSGGVGRSTPAKRLPTECENLDNISVSLEHSAEKRRGVSLVKWDSASVETVIGRLKGVSDTLEEGTATITKDLWFHWFHVSANARYLIAVDYKADTVDDTLWWVFKIDKDGELQEQAVTQPSEDDEIREYITHGNETNTAQEALRAVAVGSSILILNTKVKAGFTSDAASGGKLYDMDGTILDDGGPPTGTSDTLGQEVEYITSTTVDPKGTAEPWTEWSQYIGGEEAIDDEDRLHGNASMTHYPPWDDGTQTGAHYDYLRKGIWEVKDEVAIVVGPDVSGVTQRRPSHGIIKELINAKLNMSLGNSQCDRTGFVGGSESKKATDEIVFTASATEAINDAQASVDPTWAIAIGGTLADGIGAKGFRVPYYPQNYLDTVGAAGGGNTDGHFRSVRVTYNNSVGIGNNVAYTSYNEGTGVFTDEWETTQDITSWINSNSDAGGFISVWMAIGIKTASSYSDIMKQTAAGINKLFDMGLCHCTAEVNSRENGVNLENQYYAEQWIRSAIPEEEWATENVFGEPVDININNPPSAANPWAYYSDFIKAMDYYYPDPNTKYLGQAVARLSDLRFPPGTSDIYAFNGADHSNDGAVDVTAMLAALYPGQGDLDENQTENGGSTGLGKIYYLSQAYLGLSEGHYRVRSLDDLPYLHQIRTPELMSVIDKRRMPKQLTISTDTEAAGWIIRDVSWDERKSGSIITNPGPSIFHDGDGNAVHREISALSFYRGRLFLASEDILVSSALNNFDNFWVRNPESISVSDPVDLRVSSNAYTPITYLQPYRNFLFLATDGSTQYELLGSENQISPLTAEIAPTSFFSMARDVEPVLLNNSLFFLDKKKLYIYFGEQTDSAQNSMEISVNVPEYLPVNYKEITVSPVTGSIFMVDSDNLNHIYCYTNRISGTQILQNSFYRFILQDGVRIKSLESVDDLLYIVWEESITDDTDTWNTINMGYIDLKNEDLTEPRMDNLLLAAPSDIKDGSLQLIDSNTSTLFSIKNCTADVDRLMLKDTFEGTGSDTGTLYNVTAAVSTDNTDREAGYIEVTVVGTPGVPVDLTTKLLNTDFYLGKRYTSTIEMSPIYYRDSEQNAQNGYLSLRNQQLRFRNSGDFNVNVTRANRTPVSTHTFAIDVVGARTSNLTYKPYEETGIFKVPILGFSHDIGISITSDSVYPLAISDVEFTSKFKSKLANLGSM